MTPEEFGFLARRLRPHAAYFYLHVMGEPLLHPELPELLRLCAALEARPCLTTNGTLLSRRAGELLGVGALHKLSVSLHSMEGSGIGDLTGYLEGVWRVALEASARGVVCALRLWNIGGAEARNGEILGFLSEKLGVHPLDCPQPRQGSFRLGERLYLELAEKFDWPGLTAPETGAAFCRALRDQAAVLCDGTVVPCCLDHEGDIPLGNLFEDALPDILAGHRARALYEGFSRRQPAEELCRRCQFACRFGR